jgi:putative hydrolase of the HAD superfamily
MIKAITFDLDDTLWAIEPVIVKANQQMLDWMNQHAPKFSETYDDQGISQLRDEAFANNPHMLHDLSHIRLCLIEMGLSRCGYKNATELAKKAFAVYFEGRNKVELFPDAQSQLKALKKEFMIGALTNGNADLEKVGLDHLFDFYYNSAQLGVSKPTPKFFETAINRAQCPASQFIHIGDHPEHDIAGAKAVGMNTIWMNPHHLAWPSHLTKPDGEIHHLNQLTKTVAKINAK